MTRRILLVLAACAGTLALAAAPAEAAGYHYTDLSPSIPQLSGKSLSGVWNDGTDWLVTNGSLVLLVSGTGDHRVTNLTSEVQHAGMFSVQQAAGANGTWLLAGSMDGTTSYYAYPANKRIFVEIRDGKATRVDLSSAFAAAANASYYYPMQNLFRAGGMLFMAARTSYDGTVHLYTYASGGVLTERPVADDTVSGYLMSGMAQDGDRVMVPDSIYLASTQGQWHVFDGVSWTTEQHDDTKDYYGNALFSAIRGTTYRDDYSAVVSSGRLASAYGMSNSRDAIAFASRRADGTALLSGYGTNGLRLIVATPAANEIDAGTVLLTVSRFPRSASRYVVHATATGPVNFIRILKDGIGIAKCFGQTCSVTVNVTGTADRFEAIAPSTLQGNALTSKATILYDTKALGAAPSWVTPYGSNDQAWTWASPSSFQHESGELMNWHIGTFKTVSINQSVCSVATSTPYSSACTFKADPKKVTDGLATISTLRTDIYVEGVKRMSCTTPAADLAKAKEMLSSAKTTYSAYIQTRIADCNVSITREDSQPITIDTGYGSYQTYATPAQVRVYAKVSWTENGKPQVLVSPTDTITFE